MRFIRKRFIIKLLLLLLFIAILKNISLIYQQWMLDDNRAFSFQDSQKIEKTTKSNGITLKGKRKGPKWIHQPWKPSLRGSLNVHVWLGWCGSTVNDLRRNIHFPKFPDVRLQTSVLYLMHDAHQFGQRIFGYIHPPKTGVYSFAISSDDSSELWLSTNHHPDNTKLTAWVGNRHNPLWNGKTADKEFYKYQHQISKPVYLIKNKHYFIDVLHKQSTGNDHLLVAWQFPGSNNFSYITSKRLSRYIHSFDNHDYEVVNYAKLIPLTSATNEHVMVPDTLVNELPKIQRNYLRTIAKHKEQSVASKLYRTCPYTPSYSVDFKIRRYEGVYLIHETAVFPDDYTYLGYMEIYTMCTQVRYTDSHGNYLSNYDNGGEIKPLVDPNTQDICANISEILSQLPFKNEGRTLSSSREKKGLHKKKTKNKLLFPKRKILSDNNDMVDDNWSSQSNSVVEPEKLVRKKREKPGDNQNRNNSVSKNVDEDSVSKHGDEDSVSKHGDEDSVSKHGDEDNVSKKHGDEDSVSKHGDEDSVSKYGDEDSVSKHGDEDSVSKHGDEDSVSKHGDEDSVSKHGDEDSVSKYGDEDSVSKHGDEDSVSKHGDEDSVSKHGDEDSVSKHGDEDNVSKKHGDEDGVSKHGDEDGVSKHGDSNNMENRETYIVDDDNVGREKYEWQSTNQIPASYYVELAIRKIKELNEWHVFKQFLKDNDLTLNKRNMRYVLWKYLHHKPKRDKVIEYVYKQNIAMCRTDGNILLNKDVAGAILLRYLKDLRQYYQKPFELKRIVNIEENHDVFNGDRYLIEVDIQFPGEENAVRFSDYVFLPFGRRMFCLPEHFVWQPTATVHVIVPVKDQGKWVQHFIDDMSELYEKTSDKYLNVIIMDFDSSDIDIERSLKQSSLKRYKVLKAGGSFQRALGIQLAANEIQNPNDIVLTMDLHLEIPDNMIDIVRKHCIQGKMAFSPMVMRLNCGFTPSLPFGEWEIAGYGIFAIYKSDFDRIGGMNYKEFTTKWGGEDWELVDRCLQSGMEIERIRVPYFYHFYHSKDGLWGRYDFQDVFENQDITFEDEVIVLYDKTKDNSYHYFNNEPLSPAGED